MRLVVAISLLLFVGSAWAGSASEPEIVDGTTDATANGQPACPPEPTACAGPGQVIDITQAWIVEYEDKLTFAVQTLGSEANKAYGPMTFDATFVVAGVEFTAGVLIGMSSTAGGDDAVEPRGIATDARIGGDQYEFDVSRADIGAPIAGDVLSGFYFHSALDNAGSSGARTEDRAPDADGVEFVFALGAPPAPDTLELNVTGELVHDFNGTGAMYRINWTGPANVTMAFTMAGNGTVNLTVLDPAGTEQFTCRCTGNETQHFQAEAGAWAIHLDYSAFNGTASLRMFESPTETHQGTPPSESEGNTTTTDEPEQGEESPLPLVVGLVGLVAAVALRRR